MRFSGEIKFPDVDHPGVPVGFVIEDSQAEVQLDGETLGRWSLYDVHARRLVGNAFSVDLDGTEVTFLAEDPIDFAYRGVEHMAETWAGLKAKSIATRGVAVRKSRKGTSPSRLSDLREAMLDNLSGQVDRQLAGGSASTPSPHAPSVRRFETRDEGVFTGNAPAPEPVAPPPPIPDIGSGDLEDERRQLVEMRAQLERELREAEQRESDRIEAFRIEMQRLEAERAALEQERLRLAGISPVAAEDEEPYETLDTSDDEEVPAATESTVQEAIEEVAVEPEPEIEAESEPELEPEAESEPELEPEVEPDDEVDNQPEPEVTIVDVDGPEEAPAVTPLPQPEPEPAMAGANGDKAGLMGAVRAAFTRGGGRVHEHHFVTAPGGIGITRYVCEECGYVSISVGDD